MAKKRIVVAVNKWWECDPVMAVLVNNTARPAQALGWPEGMQTARPRPDQAHLPSENPAPAPRAVFRLKAADAEVWCISDLMEHLPDQGRYQSSSQQKAGRLPKVFRSRADFLVSVGTAAFPDTAQNNNGAATVGSKVFLHNGHPNGENPDSNWQDGPFDRVLDGRLSDEAFKEITSFDSAMKPTVADRFFVPPLNPGSSRLICNTESVALGTLNVTDPAEYDKADRATIASYTHAADPVRAASIDTTHGLVRV